MDIALMRVQLTQKYPGTKWAVRVSQMSDSQVLAIYMRMNSRH